MNDLNCNLEDLGENGRDRSPPIVILEKSHQAPYKCVSTLTGSIKRKSILRVSTFHENTFAKQSNKSVTFQPNFKCNVCDFPCDSPTLFRQHLDSMHSRPLRNLHEIAGQKVKTSHESLSGSGIKVAAESKTTRLTVSRAFKMPRARCSGCFKDYASSYLKIHKLRAHHAAANSTSDTHATNRTSSICQGVSSQSTATKKPASPSPDKGNRLTRNPTQIRSSTSNGGSQNVVMPKKPLFYTFNQKTFNIRSSLKRVSLNTQNLKSIKEEVFREAIINEELKSTAILGVGPNKLETSFKTSKHTVLEITEGSTSTGLEKAEGQKSLFNPNFETPKSRIESDRIVTFRRNIH